MPMKQQTIKNPVTFSGKGLHTGVRVTMTVNPAPADTGIVFRRTDIEGCPVIPALCDYVTDTSRGTTIEKDGHRISTIEHIISALWTLGVDNARIDIDAPETPIMDGSSREYAEAITGVGLEELPAERKYYHVTEKMVYTIPEKGVAIILYPDDEFSVSLHVDYNSKVIGNQYATFNPGDDYTSKIAPCRTFVFLHELEPLMKMNLIKGGDLDNAIVVVENPVPDEQFEHLKRIFNKTDIEITGGYLNNLELRFNNELARHKLLDLLGDFALLGMRIKGRVWAIPEKGVAIILYPDDEFSVSLHVDYNSKVIGNQYATFNPGDDYTSKIAPCRTFVFLHELEPLMKMNLIKGGDLDNAIVVVENPVPDEQFEHLKRIFNKTDIEITGGYLNNLELRFNNELARHKLLDLLGDFALLGMRIKGRVWATRPGHFANTEFMNQLKRTIRKEGEKPRFQYDCRKPALHDINSIRRMLPHRPPFLLVDRIFHLDAQSVGGIKNVTMNEPFFVGHFPEEPVMPGVLIIEAMAQCSGILVLGTVPDPENYSTYFMKIDGVKFKRKVVPGDTLQFEIQLLEPIRRGVAVVEGKAFVGETLACEAVMMAQIVKNKK